MPGHEYTGYGTRPEGRISAFIERYDEALNGLVDAHLTDAGSITAGHQEELTRLIEEGWTDKELAAVLEDTNSLVGEAFGRTYTDIDDFFAGSHQAMIRLIPTSDRRLWHAIQRQVDRSGIGSAEVEALFSGASSKEAMWLMRTAYDQPLWELAQEQAAEVGLDSPELADTLAKASSPQAAAAMNAGLDHPAWQAVRDLANSLGPDDPRIASLDVYASDPAVLQAVKAGLDYPALRAVRQRRRDYDRGLEPQGTIGSALESATPLARQIIEESLAQGFAARSRGGRPEYDERLKDLLGSVGSKFGRVLESLGILEYVVDEEEEYFEDEEPMTVLEIPNPYEVLGVSQTATEEEIKAAYRKLAKQHHTDIGGDGEQIKDINSAYDTLKDAKKRAYYDRYGHMTGYGT